MRQQSAAGSVSHSPRRRYWVFLAALASLLVLGLHPLAAAAQTSTLSGFITDESTGEALELVNVVIRGDEGFMRGAVTNRDGLFVFSRLPSGRYTMQATYVGFESYADTIAMQPGQDRTVNISLAPETVAGREVVVQSERPDGAARVTAGQQTVRPADIERIPTPALSGDLAAYLTTHPGIVSSGDRGGQLFIRGGEPSQNLVQLDGMLLYQPFHILGFYSAFPSDILSRTDIYAGGFGSRFGNRLSSVIDVWTRDGNKRRFSGSASLSPFVSSARLEGPLFPGRVSFLASVRESTIQHGAERLVDAELPFRFGDAFAKIHAEVNRRSRLSISAIQTHDRGTLGEEIPGSAPEEIRWENRGAILRYLMLPGVLPIVGDLRVSHSRLRTELGPPDEPSRVSDISNSYVGLDATFFGDRLDVDAGLAIRLTSVGSFLGGLYQNIELRRAGIDHFSLYLEPEFDFGGGLLVRPGVRLQFYRVRIDPFVEPRLRVVWNRGNHQLSGALGLYFQEILGLNDRRDAASVFTAWSYIPRKDDIRDDVRAGRMPRAFHAIVGYRATPFHWLELSLEGFFKELDNLFVSEWTAVPRFTTRLQPADGRSVGFDARVELRRGAFYGYVNYGLSSTRYFAEHTALPLWYGVEQLRFRPPHDRRHQLNAVASAELFGFDLSLRWELGSGLPFSQAVGFDGFVFLENVGDVRSAPSTQRVIYERPFNALLPAYHRLDVALERTFSAGPAEITVQGSVINAYDRANIFYVDVFTLRRVNQLPFVPSFGLRVSF